MLLALWSCGDILFDFLLPKNLKPETAVRTALSTVYFGDLSFGWNYVQVPNAIINIPSRSITALVIHDYVFTDSDGKNSVTTLFVITGVDCHSWTRVLSSCHVTYMLYMTCRGVHY